jgi:uncharacterized membrane protein YphA (DoxX/SURF4 family)
MEPNTVEPKVETPGVGSLSAAPPWSLAKLLGFRWLFTYLVLYMLQPSPLDFVAPGLVAPYTEMWAGVVRWMGAHLLGLPITVMPNASGDTTFNYVQVLCYAILASAVAAVWTAVDRGRRDHRRLHAWLRAAVRVYLAVFMFLYGAAKVVKTQFPDLSPTVLELPLGTLSPNALLWTFMGASTLYTAFVGLAEMVGGLLLISRRTTLLGALVCAGVMSNVVMLNLSYDVVVKLFSLHLLAFALFLAAPDARRLADLFLRNRPVPAVELPALASPRRHRAVLVARTVGLVAVAVLLLARQQGSRSRALQREGHVFFQGSWVVTAPADGAAARPPVSHGEPWRRLVIDPSGRAAVQLAGGEWRRFQWFLAGRSLELSEGPEVPVTATLQLRRSGPGRLALRGEVEGLPVAAELARLERRYAVLDRGIHWVREVPVM